MVEKARVIITSTDNKLGNNKILDDEYTRFLSYLSNGKTIESLVKEREKAENQFVDDDIDPDYENVLSCLKEWGNSYLLEVEIDGFVTIIKYEEQEQEYICFEREFDQEPKRKLRRFSRTEYGVSNQSKSVEIENGNRSKSNSGFKGGKNSVSKLKAVNFGTDGIEPDVDYYCFIKNCKFVDDCMLVYKYKGYEIVYCKKDEEKVKHDGNDSDGSSSDVEIIDSASFYKKDNVNEDGEVDGDFRRQVIANLKRSYDQMEYDKLWGDISFCKPKLHHKELRKGRELSCVMDTVGKSYLEYFPDIKRLLHKSRDDKLTSLNLLRGFFFWLKYQVRDGSFKPWQDTECLSLNSGSCLNFKSSFQCISLE